MKYLAIALLFPALANAETLEEVAASPKTFAVCKAADIASTAYLLKTGAGVEGNPFVAPLIAHGYFPLFLLSYGVYLLMQKYSTPVANITINGVTCGVAASNLLLIK